MDQGRRHIGTMREIHKLVDGGPHVAQFPVTGTDTPPGPAGFSIGPSGSTVAGSPVSPQTTTHTTYPRLVYEFGGGSIARNGGVQPLADLQASSTWIADFASNRRPASCTLARTSASGIKNDTLPAPATTSHRFAPRGKRAALDILGMTAA